MFPMLPAAATPAVGPGPTPAVAAIGFDSLLAILLNGSNALNAPVLCPACAEPGSAQPHGEQVPGPEVLEALGAAAPTESPESAESESDPTVTGSGVSPAAVLWTATSGPSPGGPVVAHVAVATPPSIAAPQATPACVECGASVAPIPVETPATEALPVIATSPGNDEGTSSSTQGQSAPQSKVFAPDVLPLTPTAAPAAPSSETASASTRFVERVEQIVEQLELAGPPKTVVVDLADFNGMRITVSMRGTTVHLSFGSMLPDDGWMPELRRAMFERGLDLEGDVPSRGDSPDADPNDERDRRRGGSRWNRNLDRQA